MDTYILLLTLFGLAAFGMAWMPSLTKRTGISYSIIYVGMGMLLYLVFPDRLPKPDPIQNNELAMRLSEMVVLVSLMGSGIKIDRPFSFRNWASPLKLILTAMTLSIAGAAMLGYYFLGFSLASAVLIGAVLAPTDPVLASDVQVGPPKNDGRKSETRFTLTAEAGLNDGMAFPFTWLAIVLAMQRAGEQVSLLNWFSYYLVFKIVVGFVIGYVLGRLVGYIVFSLAERFPLLKTQDGFLALSLTLLVYGLTELAHGYGFVAVFICAFTLRHYERAHEYHEELHSFTDQFERLIVAVLLLAFGGSLVTGILDALNWKMVVFSLLLLLLVRPVSAFLSIAHGKFHVKEKLAISFFGIRGMGSIYYLAFAIQAATFSNIAELWATVAFTILVSVIMHGLTATPIMKHLRRNVERGRMPT